MAKTNFTDIEVTEGILSRYTEEITSDAAISITSGVVTLNADLCVTSVDVTLPDPVVTDDDFKRLTIVDVAGLAHTVTPDTPFGNGGAGEAVATFSGVAGDTLDLIAYQGIWYITGTHQVTISA